MKNKYYIFQPRNFANEYTAIRVATPEEEKRLLAWYDKAWKPGMRLFRVTVKELREMAAEERWARLHDQAFSGYCNPSYPCSVADFLN